MLKARRKDQTEQVKFPEPREGLPEDPRPFLGSEHFAAAAALQEQLTAHCLVAVTGRLGSGKSTVCRRAANSRWARQWYLHDEDGQPVHRRFWVDLEDCSPGAATEQRVARAVGRATFAEALARIGNGKPCLLVLDNADEAFRDGAGAGAGAGAGTGTGADAGDRARGGEGAGDNGGGRGAGGGGPGGAGGGGGRDTLAQLVGCVDRGASVIVTRRSVSGLDIGRPWTDVIELTGFANNDEARQLFELRAPQHASDFRVGEIVAACDRLPLAVNLLGNAAANGDLELARLRVGIGIDSRAGLDFAVEVAAAMLDPEARLVWGALSLLPSGLSEDDITEVLAAFGDAPERAIRLFALGVAQRCEAGLRIPVPLRLSRSLAALPDGLVSEMWGSYVRRAQAIVGPVPDSITGFGKGTGRASSTARASAPPARPTARDRNDDAGRRGRSPRTSRVDAEAVDAWLTRQTTTLNRLAYWPSRPDRSFDLACAGLLAHNSGLAPDILDRVLVRLIESGLGVAASPAVTGLAAPALADGAPLLGIPAAGVHPVGIPAGGAPAVGIPAGGANPAGAPPVGIPAGVYPVGIPAGGAAPTVGIPAGGAPPAGAPPVGAPPVGIPAVGAPPFGTPTADALRLAVPAAVSLAGPPGVGPTPGLTAPIPPAFAAAGASPTPREAPRAAQAAQIAAALEDQRRFGTAVMVATAVVEAHRRAADLPAVAAALCQLGRAERFCTRYHESESHLAEARRDFEQLDDAVGQGCALFELGQVDLDLGRLDLAEKDLSEALILFEANGRPVGAANASLDLVRVDLARGRLDVAEKRLGDAMDRYEATEDKLGFANACLQLGQVELARAELDSAERRFAGALDGYEQVGDKLGFANACLQLGQVELARGRLVNAERRFSGALAGYQRVGDKVGMANASLQLGQLELARGGLAEARPRLIHALTAYEELGDRIGVAHASLQLGQVALGQGDLDEAGMRLRSAQVAYDDVGDRMGSANSRHVWAQLLEAQRHNTYAMIMFGEAARLYAAMGRTASAGWSMAGAARTSSGKAERMGYAADAVRLLEKAGFPEAAAQLGRQLAELERPPPPPPAPEVPVAPDLPAEPLMSAWPAVAPVAPAVPDAPSPVTEPESGPARTEEPSPAEVEALPAPRIEPAAPGAPAAPATAPAPARRIPRDPWDPPAFVPATAPAPAFARPAPRDEPVPVSATASASAFARPAESPDASQDDWLLPWSPGVERAILAAPVEPATSWSPQPAPAPAPVVAPFVAGAAVPASAPAKPRSVWASVLPPDEVEATPTPVAGQPAIPPWTTNDDTEEWTAAWTTRPNEVVGASGVWQYDEPDEGELGFDEPLPPDSGRKPRFRRGRRKDR